MLTIRALLKVQSKRLAEVVGISEGICG